MLKKLYFELVKNIEKCNKILSDRGYDNKIKMDDADTDCATFNCGENYNFSLYIQDDDDCYEFDGVTLERCFEQAIDFFNPSDYEKHLIEKEEDDRKEREELEHWIEHQRCNDDMYGRF